MNIWELIDLHPNLTGFIAFLFFASIAIIFVPRDNTNSTIDYSEDNQDD